MLIGVVVFVLALTILGLSLFSLSGYEAQFLGQSMDRDQAFYLATGGIERAKFALESQKTLQSVTSGLPMEGVVYARATNTSNQDTTGSLPSSVPVSIRVLASFHGERAMIETQFRPHPGPDYYKRLMTSFTHLTFGDLGPAPLLALVRPQTYLKGQAMQNDGVPGTATWASPPVGESPTLVPSAVIPQPDFATFWADHQATAISPTFSTAFPNYHIGLDGTGVSVRYFKTAAGAGPYSYWDLDHTILPVVIDVHGTVVWMLDKGIRFHSPVNVVGSGSPDDCLIIAAGNGTWGFEQVAEYFTGSISSASVPVIMVANGAIRIEHFENNIAGSSAIAYLSMFAGDVSVVGPSLPGQSMTLNHTPGDVPDQPGQLIDHLYDLGAVPNVSSDGKLSAVRGQWKQLDPDNPPLY